MTVSRKDPSAFTVGGGEELNWNERLAATVGNSLVVLGSYLIGSQVGRYERDFLQSVPLGQNVHNGGEYVAEHLYFLGFGADVVYAQYVALHQQSPLFYAVVLVPEYVAYLRCGVEHRSRVEVLAHVAERALEKTYGLRNGIKHGGFTVADGAVEPNSALGVAGDKRGGHGFEIGGGRVVHLNHHAAARNVVYVLAHQIVEYMLRRAVNFKRWNLLGLCGELAVE